MSRITHFKLQPQNTQFWDYYILCHLNPVAAMALQRMEFWDGTKEDGNVHAEDINNEEIKEGKVPTQDVSRWVYKSLDELVWELMGIVSERKIPSIIDFLTNTLKYLERRNNPRNTWDRKKQYAFQDQWLQDHVNYLGYIIAYFRLPMRNLKPIYYAIEVLTGEDKIYIDSLSVELVLKKIASIAVSDQTPHFLKFEIEKFQKTFRQAQYSPFCNFAEWKMQTSGMHPADLQNASGKSAESIRQNCSSNSIGDYTYNTNIQNKQRETGDVSESAKPTILVAPIIPPPLPTNISLSEQSKNHEEPEEQPLEAMPWGAEKALKITEKLAESKCKNKPKELAFCVKILEEYQPTEEEYIAAVQRMLKWWNSSLYPSHLLSENKTTHEIRFSELLNDVRTLQKRNAAPKDQVIKNQQLSREELIAKALAFPVGMDHTTKEYEDLQNCMMYLQPDDRKEVTKQRMLKQAEQNKQRANVNAMIGA